MRVGLRRSWILTFNVKTDAFVCTKLLHIIQGQYLAYRNQSDFC